MSGFHLIRAGLGLAPEVILTVAHPPWDNFESVARSLAAQRADSFVGFAVFLLAILLQTINVVWPLRWSDFGVSKVGVAVALGLTLVAFAGSLLTASTIRERTYNSVVALRDQQGP